MCIQREEYHGANLNLALNSRNLQNANSGPSLN